MAYDELMRLREGGSSPRVTATEAGATSTTRDATTGKVIVDIGAGGTPHEGLAVDAIADADTGTSTDKTLTLTIEACDSATFASGEVTVATFTAQSYSDTAAKFMRRRIHTDKRYLRSVITAAGSNGTISREYKIYVTNVGMETG